MNQFTGIIILSLFAFFFNGCRSGCSSADLASPTDLGDGLRIGILANEGLNPGDLASLVYDIRNGEYGEIHSFLLARNGKLVMEEYFAGYEFCWDCTGFHGRRINWKASTRHNIHSVGKCISAACIGVAIDEGFITSADQSIFDYLPGYSEYKTPGKEAISIRHLLSMTSGLQWDEWNTSYSSEKNDVISLWMDQEDPVAQILQRKLTGIPGETFCYSGGNTVLLGEIIRRATGMDIEQFSAVYLFRPLGIESVPWAWIGETQVIYAAGDQTLTPREMMKFGMLYKDLGVWDSTQLIPSYWVSESLDSFSGKENQWFNSFLNAIPPGDRTMGKRGYGYGWWNDSIRFEGARYPVYRAVGWGGQVIMIQPELDLIVVMTAANYNRKDCSYPILKRILAALTVSGP